MSHSIYSAPIQPTFVIFMCRMYWTLSERVLRCGVWGWSYCCTWDISKSVEMMIQWIEFESEAGLVWTFVTDSILWCPREHCSSMLASLLVLSRWEKARKLGNLLKNWFTVFGVWPSLTPVFNYAYAHHQLIWGAVMWLWFICMHT